MVETELTFFEVQSERGAGQATELRQAHLGNAPLQPSTRGMEPARLKAAFGDRLVFNGCIDSHHVLIDGTPDRVRRVTRETLDIMKPGGGCIVSASHDHILEETPVENVLAMFDTARDFGHYR